MAGDAGLAAGRRQQARQHPDRRRLAGAVGADKTEDVTGRDVERDPVDGDEAAEPPGEIVDLDGALAHAASLPEPCARSMYAMKLSSTVGSMTATVASANPW